MFFICDFLSAEIPDYIFSGLSRIHRYRFTRSALKSLNTSKGDGSLWNSTQPPPPNTSKYRSTLTGNRARMRSRNIFLLPIHVMGLLMDIHLALRRDQPSQTKNRYLPFGTVDIGLVVCSL